ncbi:MAG: PD-(D/E)XK nuclease family protein [Armatimonadota bacterium]
MAVKTKEQSWSLSRARMFEECPRRFYYHWHYSKNGYGFDLPDDVRLACEMKQIKGLDMWVGEIVHETIQWVLEQSRDGCIPSIQDAQEDTRRRLSKGWYESHKQLWRKQGSDSCPNLFEHYYNMPVGDAVTKRLRGKAFTCISNFMESGVFRRITTTPTDRWLPIDKYASFRIDGILFYVKFDFALKDNEYLTVFDWKTGKPSKDEMRQLACYAMYTSDRWEVPLENTMVTAVHLQPNLDAEERMVDENDIDDVRIYVRQSLNAMLKCLRYPDRGIAAIDDFPMTGNLLRCSRCNFRGICEQGKLTFLDEIDPEIEEWQ